jgi:hypothetical protein
MRIGYLILGIFFAIIVIFLGWFYISHEISHQQHAFGVSDNGNSNDKATKGDLGPNNQPGPRFHCPLGATPDPSGAKKCVFSNNNDNNNNNNNKPHNIHSKSYQQGYQMGCNDGPDQENFIASDGLSRHSKAFVKGYNDAFTHGPC